MENTQEPSQELLAQDERASQFQESLTPTLLKEDEPAYESVRDLHDAIKKDDILNIALTGPYGSGKSSVLQTLMSLNDEEWNYLPISLATLDDGKYQKTKNEEMEGQQEVQDSQVGEKYTRKDNTDGQNNEDYKEKQNRRIEYYCCPINLSKDNRILSRLLLLSRRVVFLCSKPPIQKVTVDKIPLMRHQVWPSSPFPDG